MLYSLESGHNLQALVVLLCWDTYVVPGEGEEVACSFTRTACLLHPSRPIPAKYQLLVTIRLPESEVSSHLHELHQQPIHVLDIILLLNTMILLGFLYRTACLPLDAEHTASFTKILERFVFGVLGLPLRSARKTRYTHRSHGLGLGHFPTLQPTTVLDALERNLDLHTFSTLTHPSPRTIPSKKQCPT